MPPMSYHSGMGEKSRAGQQSPMSLWELYLLVLARDKAVTHWMRHQLAPGMAWERSGGEGRDYTACTTGWHSYNFQLGRDLCMTRRHERTGCHGLGRDQSWSGTGTGWVVSREGRELSLSQRLTRLQCVAPLLLTKIYKLGFFLNQLDSNIKFNNSAQPKIKVELLKVK